MIPTSLARLITTGILLLSLLATAACSREDVPEPLRELPQRLRNLPGVPEALQNASGLWEELGLPNLGQLDNLPSLDELPVFRDEPGRISLRGPTDRVLRVGERLPGTNIELTALTAEGAEFSFGGLRSRRSVGDSLDFDGDWPSAPGITYNARLRIYYITDETVRAAGVQQLTIRDTLPQEGARVTAPHEFKFPYLTSARVSQQFTGTTLGFAGWDDRGGQITGLPAGDYSYRKIGDSVRWSGTLRSDVTASFSLRMLGYGDDGASIGGVVTIGIPQP